MAKRVILLGASGSIGQNTLEVLRKYPEHLQLAGVSCHRNIAFLKKLKKEFPLAVTALSSQGNGLDFSFYGESGLVEMIRSTKADIVLNAVAGSPGLILSWETLEAGMDLALANKESIVMAGSLIVNKAREKGLRLLPVDSEHSALFHLLQLPARPKELILTASGGAFRDKDLAYMKKAKPEDALRHPNWDMGKKITIDSATMANKGLEVIEAHYLFGFAPENIKVVIHKESLIHSLTRSIDNALYAHISKPDMKLPIQSALFYPDEKPVDSIFIEPWDLSLTFEKPDNNLFPMLPLAYSALKQGQSHCIAYNAANELAVKAFLDGKISFLQIADICEKLIENWVHQDIHSIKDVLDLNKRAFQEAQQILEHFKCQF